ncbi:MULTISPECIES: hypothetical protein [Bacillus]|jgi:polyferredoxin|uniref:DUF3899 domain-containing protein n=2 Tax=Bacillus infantis TaxID=324767 RepID=U5L4X3_9BACI|nr:MULTISPECIES: hypothetical protein [Bacillus]OXT15390.1 hypothetical protein B9K06_21270 [Bacillus sp. OG2]AGX02335.1 hypothetical protein N288_01840 [Bacillus infantis NRRL B-14911]EAR67557.1 hypothetical protein B14911_19220 [Bacillus sp. NRRL B-14911]MCK6207330.1 hypothetical protein [Bacillus infantis]MCP1156547.1 hypothetical protein [Bacillus infantis]
MKRFAIILAASLTIQALLLFSIWHFFFSGYGLIDFSFLFSALWFAFVLFFSSTGDAWTNRVIASSFMNHRDTGHREAREMFHIRVNPLLASSLLMLAASLGISFLFS